MQSYWTADPASGTYEPGSASWQLVWPRAGWYFPSGHSVCAVAPDVDAVVFVTCTELRAAAGQIVECEVVATRDYDLIAVAVSTPR